ncbi:MAG TPA: PKD domain-containing protein [Terriglobales bacterium]|nr:PKD domain-containing protein [Terriglobales bacterium]
MTRLSMSSTLKVFTALLISGVSIVAEAQLKIVPTTTLSKETANNTSASSSFTGMDNDVPAPANVSKSSSKTLLYSGNTTKMYVHFVGWFGNSSHVNVGYSSTDPAQVHRQVSDMKSRGFAGAILDWYGAGSGSDTVAGLLRSEAQSQGWQFALMEDVGAISSYAGSNICDGTQKVINDLNYVAATYEGSASYLRVNGRPVVFFFGLEAYFIDWARVRAQVSGDPLFLFRNSGGITDPNSDGGFSWQVTNLANPYDMGFSYLDNYYSTAINNLSRISFGSGYPGFNDTDASWTGNRVQHRQCGSTWIKTVAEADRYYSTSRQMSFLQVVTWDDYEEGTAIEPGIDNCLDVYAYMSGSTLYWSLNGSGSPITVSYFRIFISTDGVNLMRLKDVSSGTRSLSLGGYGLSSTTKYTLYVKAMGKPSIQNQMSAPVTYRPGNQPPVAKLSLNKSSGIVPLTITASTSVSYDPDGSISSSKIDFGDGTVLSGPTASHTYSKVDTYTVTAWVYDNRGVASVSRATINAKPPMNGVTLSSPLNGSTVGNFVHFAAIASSTSGAKITAMRIYVDNLPLYLINDDRVDTHLKLLDGNHYVVFSAWDSTGAVYKAASTIHVGLTVNQPPVAAMTLTTFSPAIGSTLRVCTAPSHDPDGSVGFSQVSFGDGTPIQNGTTTYHQYKAAGTYTITATVRDDRGATASTTSTVSVH